MYLWGLKERNKIMNLKNGSFPGDLLQEAKSKHAWNDGLPNAEEKFSISKHSPLLLDGSLFLGY